MSGATRSSWSAAAKPSALSSRFSEFIYENLWLKIFQSELFLTEDRTQFQPTQEFDSVMTDRDFSFEQFFKALADHTRLRVIHLLGTEEVCVCSVVMALQTSQPKISRHLAYLRRAGLVSARREGKWMHYRVIEPPDAYAAEIFREMREGLSANPQMQRDRERLAQLNGQKSYQSYGPYIEVPYS